MSFFQGRKPLILMTISLMAASLAGCQTATAQSEAFEDPFNSVSFVQGNASAQAVIDDTSMYLYASTYGGSCSFMASEWENSGKIDNFSTAEFIQGCEQAYKDAGWTKDSNISSSDTNSECPNGEDEYGDCIVNESEADSLVLEDEEKQISWTLTPEAILDIEAQISQYVQHDATFTCPKNFEFVFPLTYKICEFNYVNALGEVNREETYVGFSQDDPRGIKVEWYGGYSVFYVFPDGPLK